MMFSGNGIKKKTPNRCACRAAYTPRLLTENGANEGDSNLIRPSTIGDKLDDRMHSRVERQKKTRRRIRNSRSPATDASSTGALSQKQDNHTNLLKRSTVTVKEGKITEEDKSERNPHPPAYERVCTHLPSCMPKHAMVSRYRTGPHRRPAGQPQAAAPPAHRTTSSDCRRSRRRCPRRRRKRLLRRPRQHTWDIRTRGTPTTTTRSARPNQ